MHGSRMEGGGGGGGGGRWPGLKITSSIGNMQMNSTPPSVGPPLEPKRNSFL